jgi:mRNA interferase MazF
MYAGYGFGGKQDNRWWVSANPTWYSPVSIVAAITDADHIAKRYPVDVPIPKGEGGLVKDSVVQCNLVRCVDEKRFVRTLGHLSKTTMDKVDRALRISLAL